MFIVINLDAVLCNNKYIPTHSMSWHAMSASWQPTQMPYEKALRIQKECYQPYNFCGVADMLARDIMCALFVLELYCFAFMIR